jgi:hypothetical protein
LEVSASQETEIGEPPMLCSTTKSVAFNCDAFDMICPRRKRRFLLRASRPDWLIDLLSENDAFVGARYQAKLAW